MTTLTQKFLNMFHKENDVAAVVKKHNEMRKEIEESTEKLRERTEELLAEMIRKNECGKGKLNGR